jgi:hypothetical protein
MKENSKMGKPMDMEYFIIQTVQNMKENLKMG